LLTCGGRIPAGRDEDADVRAITTAAVLSDMQFDPFNVGRRFRVGLAGAFVTADGVNWERLFDTGASRGRPANCYFDWISQPSDPALYVSFAGRSIVKISGFAATDARRPSDRPLHAARSRRPRSEPAGRARGLGSGRPNGQAGTTQPMPDDRLLDYPRRRAFFRCPTPTAEAARGRHLPDLTAALTP